MPARTELPAADLELSLVRRAIAGGFCSVESIACHLRLPARTVYRWLSGERVGPAGLLCAVLRHLNPDERAAVLTWLATEIGAGEVVSLREAQFLRALTQSAVALSQSAEAYAQVRQAKEAA